ncbi:FAP224 [Auxenochlorella protothecoides x Auxenochlorella symbiontica]
MSTKEEKPQLAGVRLKTRKRNIVVPHDPQSFAEAVIAVLGDAQESDDIERTLDAANKILDSAELDFSRYGDVLFEVAFAGARLTTGGNVSHEGKPLEFNILASPAETAAIVPYIKWFQTMIRRRPFLVKSLENTLIKLILSLEFYDDLGRKKIAIALARIFCMKVGVLPDRVLPTLLEDRLVQKGTILQFTTEFYVDFLSSDSVETLMETLRKARLEGRLLEFFPQQKQSWADFEDHFNAAGLKTLVEYSRRKLYDAHCAELRAFVRDTVAEGGEGAALGALVPAMQARQEEWSLADGDVARAAFLGLADSVLASAIGRNQQQVQFNVLRTVRHYAPALARFARAPRLEAALLQTVQVTCYEESRLLKIFKDIVKILYDCEVIGETAIRHWYTKGSNAKGRNVFLQDMQPFMQWLDEAEEEESSEEEE